MSTSHRVELDRAPDGESVVRVYLPGNTWWSLSEVNADADFLAEVAQRWLKRWGVPGVPVELSDPHHLADARWAERLQLAPRPYRAPRKDARLGQVVAP